MREHCPGQPDPTVSIRRRRTAALLRRTFLAVLKAACSGGHGPPVLNFEHAQQNRRAVLAATTLDVNVRDYGIFCCDGWYGQHYLRLSEGSPPTQLRAAP